MTDDPYRGGPAPPLPAEGPSHLVADVIRQFADEPDPFRLFFRPTLALSDSHPRVTAASEKFAEEPQVAAFELAQAILEEFDALKGARHSKLTTTVIDALLGSP